MENQGKQREFDIIVYGATGFTGALVCEYLSKKEGLALGLGGRNKEKLEELRARLLKDEQSKKANKIEVILGSTDDFESLKAMTKKTTVLCNCVGPYLAHGFNIIEACLSEGAHYTDLCGEVPWIRQVVQKYHERAKEKN